MGDQNNREFAKNEHFTKACEKAGISPTKRQASKFRMKRGKAYRAFLLSGGAN